MTTRRLLQTSLLLCAALTSCGVLASACVPVDRQYADPIALFCEPGTTEPCYDGPVATAGTGSCKDGLMTCLGDGSAYGECEGQVLPSTDVCSTPEDEDCDGTALLCPLTHLASVAFGYPSSGDIAENIALDPQGNAVILVSVEGTLVLGDHTVTSKGTGTDLVLAKIDPLGKVLWARGLGGDTSQYPGGVAVDASGTIYICGRFSSTLDFNTGAVFTSTGSTDVFVAKLDSNGNPLSVVIGGDADSQQAKKIAVDQDGMVFVAGTYSGTLGFPNGPLMNAGMNSTGIYVVKLDPSLSYLASVQGQTPNGVNLNNLVIGAQGNVVVVGDFDNTFDFAGMPHVSSGGYDIFIAKLSGQDLSPMWGRQFGGTMAEKGRDIGIDSNGNIVFTGVFQGQITVGAFNLIAPVEDSIVVASLSPGGDPTWAKTFGGGAGGTILPLLEVDSMDNIIVGGSFSTLVNMPSLDFGGGPLKGTVVMGFGAVDLFLAKLNPAGNHIASKALGNDLLQVGSAIGVLTGDRIMMTGGMYGQLDFGGGLIGDPSPMESSLFVATFSP